MSRNHLGNLLVIVGVCVWVVYFMLKSVYAYDGSVMPFLFVHLLCVIPGAALAGRGWTRRIVTLFARGGNDARDG